MILWRDITFPIHETDPSNVETDPSPECDRRMDGWREGCVSPLALLLADHLSGFTPQYTGLEELYKTYHDRGLEVLGFPSNEFGGQEPGSDEDIASFCTVSAISLAMYCSPCADDLVLR
jgi:hypothetical protein